MEETRKTKMAISKWTPKKKFKCPECTKTLKQESGKYLCKPCNLDVQLVMNMGPF